MPKRNQSKQSVKFTKRDKRDLGKVKRAINAREVKHVLTSFTSDPNSTGAVKPLTAVAQGIDDNDRIGDKIMPSHFEARGIVTGHASASNTQLRMMIVRDNFGTTTTPSITDLFSSAAKLVANKSQLGDEQVRARFTVIWDKFFILQTETGITKTFVVRKKLAKKAILFSGAAGTDEGKNHLYLFIGSNEATNDPIVDAGFLFYYTD